MVEHVLAQPNANTVSDAMSTLDELYKIPIKPASQHCSWQCVLVTFFYAQLAEEPEEVMLSACTVWWSRGQRGANS